MEVFDINGQIISPLAGKTLYVAGDSIAYGKSSAGGYGKCIADKYGMTLTNEAVDGATLTPNITDKVYGGTRGCISTVVTNSTALAKADYILLEGGVNDAWNNAPVGTLTDGFAAAYDETTMTGALEKMLERIREHFGKPVTITSAYRTPAHNAKAGGAKFSQHLYGRAADIRVQGVSVEAVAAYAESLMPDRGGVGRYPVKAGRAAGWVHVDTRADKARWRG